MSSSTDYELAFAFHGFLLCNYSSLAALSFTLYDISLTFGQEIQQIWRRPWTYIKSLFVFLRTAAVVLQVIPAWWYLQMGAGTMAFTPHRCQLLLGFQGVAAQLTMFGVQMVLMLRIQALYGNNRALNLILRCLFVMEMVSMAVVLSFAIPSIQTGLFCVVLEFPTTAAGFLFTPIVFEFILFCLGMIKFYQAVRDGWGQESVIRRFLRDGVWAFVLPFTCLITNTCCMLFIKGAVSGIAYSWVVPISSFAGYRLILNMGHLLTVQVRHSTPVTIETGLEVSRNVVTADFELDEMSTTSLQ